MEEIGRAKASAQWVMSKQVESRLCELGPTIGGGDMIELLQHQIVVFGHGSEPVCHTSSLAQNPSPPFTPAITSPSSRGFIIQKSHSRSTEYTSNRYPAKRRIEIVKAIAY